MDYSFLNNSHSDIDIQGENYMNPDIARGFQIHKQPPPPQSDSEMVGRISWVCLSLCLCFNFTLTDDCI